MHGVGGPSTGGGGCEKDLMQVKKNTINTIAGPFGIHLSNILDFGLKGNYCNLFNTDH